MISEGDAQFEDTFPVSSESWDDYAVDIGDWEHANRVKYIEIGFVALNTDIPVWNGKFFIDHISGIEKAETDAALQSLSISNGVLQPAFSADVLAYQVTVPNHVARVNVTATAAGDHATLTVNGKSTASGAASDDIVLPVGTSNIQIKVTAENGLVQDYSIAVTRQGTSSVPPVTITVPEAPAQPDTDQPETEIEEPIIPNPIEVQFTDLDGHWAREAILRAVGLEFVKGYPDATFKPNQQLTRQEFAIMIVNVLQLEGEGIELPFTDASSIPNWSKGAISTALKAGIIKGYTDGSFRPNAIISREEMTVMLANAAGFIDLESKATDFADDSFISSWSKGAVSLMREMGMIRGKLNNYFDPKGSATRAEAVSVLLNLYDYNHQQ